MGSAWLVRMVSTNIKHFNQKIKDYYLISPNCDIQYFTSPLNISGGLLFLLHYISDGSPATGGDGFSQ